MRFEPQSVKLNFRNATVSTVSICPEKQENEPITKESFCYLAQCFVDEF